MTEIVFQIANVFVLPFWILLVGWPTHRLTVAVVHRGIPSALLGALYTVFLVKGLTAGDAGGFGSLAELGKLFQAPEALLAGWVHYLAFDLFIGAWEAKDAADRGISKWLVAPCLFLTLMVGPLGLLLYLGLRSVTGAKEPHAAASNSTDDRR